MDHEATRRAFLHGGALTAGGLLATETTAAVQESDPHHREELEAHHSARQYPRDRPSPYGTVGNPTDRGRLVPGLRAAGKPPVPVNIPDLDQPQDKLAWRMVDGAKEYHLYCRHTRREFLPDLKIDVWGFNGGMPGPTIEATQGDRVRIWVHNELPESTGIHWHGLEIPVSMDGVPGLTQPPIAPGESQAYEFTLQQNGTFFYHSHDGMQDGMGMVGLFLIHPKVAHEPTVDRDFALLIQEWAILPGSTIPNTMSMEFNLFTINGRAAPFITPLVCKLGERVRIRMVNFGAIDHHPMHLHGVTFWVTGNEAGRIPETAWVPGNTVLVGVAQVREIEFIANNPGDWMLHCHMFHHVMNFMSTMIGPMGGHTVQGMKAGQSPSGGMGVATGGSALSTEAFGPSLGRSMGEQTGMDHAVGTGPRAIGSAMSAGMPGMDMSSASQHGDAGHGGTLGRRVPGYPQGMMDMPMELPPGRLARLNRRETRGMRRDWYTGLEGLMTVVRILPPDLYDAVMSGQSDIPAGASTPGGGPGEANPHRHRN
jgi:FtsP/CotA-like multicopper oxidase with cupredoxin domain